MCPFCPVGLPEPPDVLPVQVAHHQEEELVGEIVDVGRHAESDREIARSRRIATVKI